MGKFRKMIDLSTTDKQQEFFNLLDSKKSMEDVYREFGLQYSNSNSMDLHKMANLVGFDLSVYKERQRKSKKHCLYCGKELSGCQKKFCSNSCAATYNNFKREPRSNDYKIKMSNTIKQVYISKGIIKKAKICNICGDENCSNLFCKSKRQLVKSLIKNFGFDENTLGTGINNVIYEYNRVRDVLYDLYWNKKLSCREILKLYPKFYGSASDMAHILKSLNISRRSISEAAHISLLKGDWSTCKWDKNFKFKFRTFHHNTWENKTVFLRSAYELEYAKFLDSNKIKYDVESIRLEYYDSQKNMYRCSVPDFYLPDLNMIVEIKSFFTYDKQNMLDKFKAFKDNNYNYKLIMDGVEYFEDNLPETSKNNILNFINKVYVS